MGICEKGAGQAQLNRALLNLRLLRTEIDVSSGHTRCQKTTSLIIASRRRRPYTRRGGLNLQTSPPLALLPLLLLPRGP